MSRTEKTNPWNVRLKNAGCLFQESHNHASGPCDLLPRSHKDAAGMSRNCYYTAATQAWYKLKICSCLLCRGGISPKVENRKSRRKEHIATNLAKREANSTLHGFDE